MGTTYSQFFPPKPVLTAAELPSLRGKVFIVTGGASGVGFELVKILYRAGGKVYIGGRSSQNARLASLKIRAEACDDPGELHFLFLALDDLDTLVTAVKHFMKLEPRLDVLFNNAGVFQPPKGSISAQGHELQLATNCLGPYLLTRLLMPVLIRTAKVSPPVSVRIVWTSSLLVDISAPEQGGINAESISRLMESSPSINYTMSKTGNWFLAKAFADELGKYGILSITQNPGNLKTQALRHLHWSIPPFANMVSHLPQFGAYTNLYAGFSSDLSIDDGGSYIIPWGRKHTRPRGDLLRAVQSVDEGGTGAAQAFAEWCKELTGAFSNDV